MTCRELIEQRLGDFADGSTEATLAARVRAHLDSCSPCSAYLLSYRATIALSRAAFPDRAAAAAPPELTQRVLHAAAAPRRPRYAPWLPAAAVLFVAIVGLASLRRPALAFRVVATAGDGPITIDGHRVSVAELSQLDPLAPGTRILVPEGSEVEATVAGTLMIRIAGGSEVELPAAADFRRRELAAFVHLGDMFLTTGPEFAGRGLVIDTPEAHVTITGTTLAVRRNAHGTCVCAYEGRIEVATHYGAPATLAPRHRRIIAGERNGDSEDIVLAIRPVEETKLAMLQDEFRLRLGVRAGDPALHPAGTAPP